MAGNGAWGAPRIMERRVLGLLYGPRALELRGAPMLEAMAEALIQGNSSELSP